MGRLARHWAVARTMSWATLFAGALACVVVTGAAYGFDESALGRWPGLGALALCCGGAFLLDDAAEATARATPTSLTRRRTWRIALALPPLCAVWAATLWFATTADGAPFGPEARGALTLQFGAMLALTLAASALALRAMPDERGGWTGVIALFALLAVAYALPRGWTLLAAPGDDAWNAAQGRWLALLALALLTLAWSSRDPAHRGARPARRAMTRSSPRTRGGGGGS